MPSELPKLGMPRRLIDVSVERKSIFSSVVISETMLSIRWEAGRAGFWNGYLYGCVCCAESMNGATARAMLRKMLRDFLGIATMGPLLRRQRARVWARP